MDAPTRTPAHRALVELEREGTLHALITQNVDGLHHAAGQIAGASTEIHGTSARRRACRAASAARCPRRSHGSRRRGRPPCLDCSGILKSATISFGEHLVPDDLQRVAARRGPTPRCTSRSGRRSSCYPAAGLPEIALRNGKAVS